MTTDERNPLEDLRSATPLKPGDRVLLHSQRAWSMQEADEARARLNRRFPDIEFAIVAGVDGVLVAPPLEVRDGR